MPTVVIDGIATRYEVIGSGPPLLMYAPGGFQCGGRGLVDTRHLPEDKAPRSSTGPFHLHPVRPARMRPIGRAFTWGHYVAQGKGLLEHLHIARAHLMGGCMGCAPVVAFAVAHPETVASMILYWPVGGAKYRISSHHRFAEHIAFARENGFDRVVTLVRAEGKPFGADPRGGPWASVIKNDAAFAAAYARQDLQRSIAICETMRDALFDRDTAPGAEPKQLMGVAIAAFIVPGHDAAHATSAARYLEECLPQSRYWDIAVEAQTEDATNPHVLEFLRVTSQSQ
jgi:pimeloyl-ACP methyl ester carboxylesterase